MPKSRGGDGPPTPEEISAYYGQLHRKEGRPGQQFPEVPIRSHSRAAVAPQCVEASTLQRWLSCLMRGGGVHR